MPGPPRKPTIVRINDGNPSRRPINGSEPSYQRANFKPVVKLSGTAKRVWSVMVDGMAGSDLVRETDIPALTLLAQQTAQAIDALSRVEAMAERYDKSTKSEPIVRNADGQFIANPVLAVLEKHARIAIEMCAQARTARKDFGFDPSSRSQLHEPVKQYSALEEALA